MPVEVKYERLLNHELKAQVAELMKQLASERLIALQRGGSPQNDDEKRYQKLYAAMQARGLGSACNPPQAPTRSLVRQQQQQPGYLMEGKRASAHAIRVPSLYGNH